MRLEISTKDEHILDLKIGKVAVDTAVDMIGIVLVEVVAGMTDMRQAQAVGLEIDRAETGSSGVVENVVPDTGSVGIVAAVAADLPMRVAGKAAARLKV